MKKFKFLLIFTLVFSLVISVPLFAYAGTVQYATNSYSNVNTYSWPSDVSYFLNKLGHSWTRSHNPSASTIMSIMQYKNYFIWCGHGEPGTMLTSDNNFYDAYATNAAYCIKDDVPDNSISGVVWFLGCSQGATSGNYGNLLQESIRKSPGYTDAFGPDMNLAISTSKEWHYQTWKIMSEKGISINNAIYDAANIAGANDIYGFNSSHVSSWWG